jgi:hypothetical protein
MAHTTSSPSQTRPAYAGIGSRATPPAVLDLMTRAASWLSGEDWVLRTGMAAGADQAFYRGASTHGAFELYLPWPTFEADAHAPSCRSEQFVLGEPTPAAHELAARFHPAWSRLTRAVRALHARNAHQVLGADLASPARFVLCWTPGRQPRRPWPACRRDRPGAAHRPPSRHRRLQPRPARAPATARARLHRGSWLTVAPREVTHSPQRKV